jgi:tetratricopeptide (TPR) repeat protein
MKQYDRAIADFDEAIRVDPNYAAGFSNRGVAYMKKEDYDRAIADFDEAIRVDPNYADGFSNRGLAYVEKEDYDRAITDFDEAIRIDPNYAAGFSNRGIAYLQKEDYDRAITDFDQAIRLDPQSAKAYGGRALVFHLKNDYDRAIADYGEAIKLDPDFTSAIDLIAKATKESDEVIGKSVSGVEDQVLGVEPSPTSYIAVHRIQKGDQVEVRYLDDNRTVAYTLGDGRNNPAKGVLSVSSPLGKRLIGLVEGDEVELGVGARMRRILIVRVERRPSIRI